MAVSVMGIYSFDDVKYGVKEFVGGFISLTGNAIFPIDGAKDVGFEKIDVPEPTIVSVEKEVVIEKEEVVEEKEEVKEEVVEETPVDTSSGSSSSPDVTDYADAGDYVPACSDFVDNNVNYYKKGICKGQPDSNTRESYFEDYCSEDGVTLMEYSCGSSSSCDGSWYVCANGCRDGACLTEKEEPLAPDLKVVSVRNKLTTTSITVRNTGTRGTYFKTRIVSENFETVADVDYFLEPSKTVEIDVGDKIDGKYSIEILSDDEDSNPADNLVEVDGGIIEIVEEVEEEEPKEVETMITGGYAGASADGSVFSKFFDFLRKFF